MTSVMAADRLTRASMSWQSLGVPLRNPVTTVRRLARASFARAHVGDRSLTF